MLLNRVIMFVLFVIWCWRSDEVLTYLLIYEYVICIYIINMNCFKLVQNEWVSLKDKNVTRSRGMLV